MGLTVATSLFSHKPVQEIIAALVLKVKMWDRKYKYAQRNVMRYQFIGLARFRQAHYMSHKMYNFNYVSSAMENKLSPLYLYLYNSFGCT